MTPAVRAIIIANVALYIVGLFVPAIFVYLGLSPAAVLHDGWVWQLATYQFLHSPTSIGHILFNMLAVWMFGVELERRWGTVFFTKFYFVCGIGAAICTLLISLLPFEWAAPASVGTTIGASGAVYGLLLAWALIFPHRQILFMFLFPLPARVFVAIMGAVALFSALQSTGGPVANIAHLGGLVAGFLYLKGWKDAQLALKYRMTKWRMNRLKRRFDVYQGGRSNRNDRIH